MLFSLLLQVLGLEEGCLLDVVVEFGKRPGLSDEVVRLVMIPAFGE